MFEIKECTDRGECERLAGTFGAPYAVGDRAFVFYENGPIGMGVLGLEGGSVAIKAVTDCGSAAYNDVLLRAVLNVLNNMGRIRVVWHGHNDALKPFGFVCEGDGMTVYSDEIRFPCGGES